MKNFESGFVLHAVYLSFAQGYTRNHQNENFWYMYFPENKIREINKQ